MELELRFFANFRTAVGQKTITREFEDGATVGDVLTGLESEFEDLEGDTLDDEGEIITQLSVLKNGREVQHMAGAETVLEDGDTLSVFPPVAGGTTTRREKSYRGISLRLAIHYLENLGGERVDGGPPADETTEATLEGDDWRADLSAEKVDAAGALTLTEVSIGFEGDEGRLDQLIDKFSQKAMRAGG
jgi:molybdopterin synthase sulfur carrier subunit